MTHSPPVLIVGAGPTGLMMAGELARYGIPCRIIDKAAGPGIHSRAIAVQSRTMEIFSHLGMGEELVSRGVKIRGMQAHLDGNRSAQVSMEELDTPYPFVLGIPQTDTEAILTHRLAQWGVTPEWGTTLGPFSQEGQSVTATLHKSDGTTETVQTRYLLGCDGAHSPTRKGAGLTFLGETYEAGFALADVQLDWDYSHDWIHVFPSRLGLFAATPLPGTNRYRLFWEFKAAVKIRAGQAAHHGEATDRPPPSLADVQQIVSERVPSKATVSHALWTANFRVNSRMAAGYRNGQVFLAGDAAHIHSPAGGQGMNTGLQDAFNLAWKLALVEKGLAKPQLLDTYHQERHFVGVQLLTMTNRLIRMGMVKHPVLTALRNRLLPILFHQSFLQKTISSRVSELAIHYRDSPLSVESPVGSPGSVSLWRHRNGAPQAGDRAPDAPVSGGRLYDWLRDPRHLILLLFSGPKSAGESHARHQHIVQTVTAKWGQLVRPHLIDSGDTIAHETYHARAACLYLLRPDGYIGFRSPSTDVDNLTDYLRSWYVGETN